MTVVRILGGMLVLATALAGCGEEGVDTQSSLNPAGSAAAEISSLWWLLFLGCSAVYLLVVGLLAWGLLRRGRRAGEPPVQARAWLWLGIGGLLMPVVVLTIFLVPTLRILASQSEALDAAEPLTIKVIGHRWWWEVVYDHPDPQRRLTTANEIWIPVGRTMRIELESRDVIHSFWVPALQGKLDLVPGRINATTLEARVPGTYRGQCAEFCGLQHANMALTVVAVEQGEFEAWYERQTEPAAPPGTALTQEGQRVFLEKPCAVCHAVRGTLALGSVGPDLTHLASRQTIAAGTLPMSRGHLGGWISDPQGLKPGNMMPNVDLSAEEFLALLAYLESLE